MKTYIVHHYHAVEIKVQAESAEDAKYIADELEHQYTLTATFDNREGGPEVYYSNYDMEIIEQ